MSYRHHGTLGLRDSLEAAKVNCCFSKTRRAKSYGDLEFCIFTYTSDSLAKVKTSSIMHIRGIFTICILIFPLLMAAQSPALVTSSKPALPKIGQGSLPLNLDSVSKAIVYPPAALKARIEGTVIMQVMFNESGRYTDHSLLTAPHFLLTNEAEDKVRLLRFEPTIREGRPVPGIATVPFEFKLPAKAIDPDHRGSEIGPPDPADHEIEPFPLNQEELKQRIGYPPMAKEAEIEGNVILRVLVNAQGEYVKHIVIEDPYPILTQAVISKLSQLRFAPSMLDRKPISAWVNVTFGFWLLH